MTGSPENQTLKSVTVTIIPSQYHALLYVMRRVIVLPFLGTGGGNTAVVADRSSDKSEIKWKSELVLRDSEIEPWNKCTVWKYINCPLFQYMSYLKSSMQIPATRYFGSITIFVSVATRMLVKGSCFSRAYGSVNDDWSFERSVAGVFLTWAYGEKETVVSDSRYILAGMNILDSYWHLL